MAVVTEKELNESLRVHWLKAVAALELRNFGYAISLLQMILKQEPQFLTARQLLRRTEITKAKSARKSFLNLSTASFSLLRIQRDIRKEPKRAVESIEEILENEPTNKAANLALKEAAIAAGWPEIGVLALQTILEEQPQDTKIWHELGRLYHEMGESDRAVQVYQKINELDPLDAEALRLGKDSSARASMKTGGWTQAESYRDLMKDKETAISLEQQSRMTLGEESIDRQIQETYERHQTEPQNVDLARRLGSLYEQKQDLENAIAWYRYAAELTNNADEGLVRKVTDLQLQQLDHEIAALETASDESARATLVSSKQRRAELLVTDAQKRVERNPTDLQLRFELGEELLRAGRYREALPELQRARQNPNARLKAMNLLGRCYGELGMLDLAAKQFEDAAREILQMDATKKEIVYNLGVVYERMGEAEKSITAMKQIYEADYGYRDVAARVESSYERESHSG